MRTCVSLLLWVCFSSALWAQSPNDIRSFLSPRYRVESIKTGGDYGLVTVGFLKGEGEGTVLVRQLKGKWVELAGGGGALGPLELYRYGVPRRYWSALTGSASIHVGSAQLGPCWTETSQRLLKDSDLEFLSAWELTLMRNEIFARHGKVFQDPILHEYFASRTWYRPRPTFQLSMLNEVEKKNAAKIAEIQQRSGKQF